MLVSLLFLSVYLAAAAAAAGGYNAPDVKRVFRENSAINDLHVYDAIASEHRDMSTRLVTVVACADYANSAALLQYLAPFDAHPVYSSGREQTLCHVFMTETSPEDLSADSEDNNIRLTIVPPVLKIDESLLLALDELAFPADKSQQFVLELSHGIGVRNKGMYVRIFMQSITFTHSITKMMMHFLYYVMLGVRKTFGDVGMSVVTHAMNTLKDKAMLHSHWDKFYFAQQFTADAEVNLKIAGASGLGAASRDSPFSALRRVERLRGLGAAHCDLSKVTAETWGSHVVLSSKNTDLHPHCMVFLATVAVSRGDISYALGYHGYAALANSTSIPFNTPGSNGTDQNSWIQSGNSDNKPFSDMGIDGAGYVVGYADSGADDLSCFLIDDSLQHTTRTPRSRAATPVTEMQRRKVVQYVAYADGWPSVDYDHGTWCTSG
jgi:hypothetical protein